GTVRAPFTLEESLRRIAKKDETWASRVTLALTGDVDSLDLAVLAAADTTFRTLDGTATLDTRITGTAQAPVITLSGNVPWVTYQGVEGRVQGLALAYAARRLAIAKLEFTQGNSNSTVEGDFPLDLSVFAKERILRDDPLRLSVRVPEADFKIAALVSPLIGASGGRLKITADITGTPRKSKITGSMELADGMLRVAGRDEVLEGIKLLGAFDEEKLTITEVTARQGKSGRLTGSGTWRWSATPPGTRVASGPPGEYAFTIRATDFTTSDRETYLLRVTGTFDVKNGRSRSGEIMPRITGNAVLSKGDLTLKLTEPSEEPPAEVPFLYDVTVDVPNGLFYRTVDSDVELTGKLRLMNDGAGDLALGVMSVKKGRYYFFTREIGNLTGDFTFNSVDKIDPELAVDGETRLDQEHVINVSLTGRASQPVVHLWGGKGLEGVAQADLWKALTFGQISAGADDPLSSGESSSGLNVPIRDYLFRNAERWLSSSGFIDTIDLRSGERSGTTQETVGGPIDLGAVGVGKYVTSDLFLNYSRDFSGQNDQFVAEYRVTRHLLLRGGRELTQRTTVLGSGEQQYNLDLKIRLEY
ncbi:MAG TPA: translocation/assembly module TamB domain-containing protein, partial [Candidatus Eisenbacteria bacterium]|nr:translocation/assembly module TamB domain-containing protein [Candidatus Eisenbacteria bacterium]